MLGQENYTINIPKDKPIHEDYIALKDLGLSIIQQYSKNVWTDFNASDPGLTTLELLCYALTDLSYRTQLPLQDLLTEPNQETPFNKKNSYKAEEILIHNPLTIQDYRKLILDKHPEIRNVWFYPIKTEVKPTIYIHKNKEQLTLNKEVSFLDSKILLQGLYDVKVETIGKPKNTIENIYKTLHGHRNLSEDFHCINFVEFEYVTICMDVDLDGAADPETVKEEVYRQLYLYCAPHLQRYSLKQMLAKGVSMEEVFEGPALKNGFFDLAELENFDKKDVLYVSDLINIFMDIPGISNIRKIHLNSYDPKNNDINLDAELYKDEEYCLHLIDIKRAFRFFVDRIDKQANKINFYYDGLKLHEPELVAEEKLIPKKQYVPSVAEEWENVESQYRNIKPYYSIQNEFPKAYMLGFEGITGEESTERQIQRLQFKGYLLHFEQILANYLAQLNHVKKLLSWSSDADYRSYMYQSLSIDEIKDLEDITTDRYRELFDQITNDNENHDFYEQVLHISSAQNFDRRNRFLNHLIARFNDCFVEFSVVEFFKKNNKTYGKHSILADKKSFLRTYPYLSGNRLKSFDYTLPVWNTTNISGYEMRVAKKLGLTNYLTSNPDLVFKHSIAHPVLTLENLGNVSLTDFYNYNEENFDKQFGFHIIEHLLLRPRSTFDDLLTICNENKENILDCTCKDPYSFRMTVVLPGWLPITLNTGFRTYVERVFREELPAHLCIKLCWIGPQQMLDFEKCYFDFFKDMAKEMKVDCKTKNLLKNDKLTALLNTIQNMDNIYYPSHLVDCEDIDYDFVTNEITKHPTILGQTKLNATLSFGVNWVVPEQFVYERFVEFNNVISYRESEGIPTFYLLDKPIKIDEPAALILKLSNKKLQGGKITLRNNKSLAAYVTEEEIVTSFRLQNLDNEEVDVIWVAWKGNNISINLNRQVDFSINLTEITEIGLPYHLKLNFPNSLERCYKVDKIESRPHLKQHVLEKMWLEKQYDSTFVLPKKKEIETPNFLAAFMKEVKERVLRQKIINT